MQHHACFIKEEGGDIKKDRHIWNGATLNEKIQEKTFTMETVQALRKWVPLNCWSAHFDFSKSFYHGLINEKSRKYFGYVTRDKEGNLHYWCFHAFPRGFTLSPYIFHKLCIPFLKYLRRLSILISLYCDDGFIFSKGNYERCVREIVMVRLVLKLAGFTVNEVKSGWIPSKINQHIGFTWDFTKNTIAITDKRLTSIHQAIDTLKTGNVLSCKQGLSIVRGR